MIDLNTTVGIIQGIMLVSAGLLFRSAYNVLFKNKFKTGEGLSVIPKGVKWVSVSVKGGGSGGSGRDNSGSSTATVGITNQETDLEMVFKLKY